MKRCLTAAAAMLVLAAVLLPALSLRLDGTATPLPYTVALARGDIAAAEGLRFRTAIKYGSQLRWDTVYNVHDNTWDTTHRLVSSQGNDRLSFYDRQEDREALYYGLYNDQRYISLIAQPDDPLMTRLIQGYQTYGNNDPYGNGWGYTERIRLRDFYDIYPLYLSPDYGDLSLLLRDSERDYYADSYPAFDKLRIPVGETDWMEPTLFYYGGDQMYLSGDTTLHAENRFTPFSIGREDGFLTTVGFAADADPQPEWAPEGFGLWYAPMELNSYTFSAGGGYSLRVPDMARLRLVYPLDIAEQRVVGLQFTYDQSEILLTTAENGQYVLRVLDAADFRCKLTLVVDEDAELQHHEATMGTQNGTSYELDCYNYVLPVYNSSEDLLVACIRDHLTVLRPGGDGWVVDFSFEMAWPRWNEDGQLIWSDLRYPLDASVYGYDYGYIDGFGSPGLSDKLDEISMLYRDGKLALATGDSEGTYTLVSVYDRTGMLYGAVLNAGLSTQAVRGPWWFFDPIRRTELLWD